MIDKILTAAVPEPPGNAYSNALMVSGVLYMAGQHGGKDGGGVAGDGSFADQAREALRRLVTLVEAAGGTVKDIVKLTVYVTDMGKRAELGAVRREFFAEPMPCSTLVGITALAMPELEVEIDAVAVIGAGTKDRT